MGAARLVSSQGFRLILGTGVSLLTLYLAFHKVSFPGLWQALGVVNLNWVLLALVSVGANTISKVVRWKGLMGQPGDRIRWGQVFISFLAGSLLNWVYPARLGDFSRATIIGNQGPGTIFILGTITLEKLLDTLFYVLLILLLLLIVPLPAWIQSSAQGFALASILLIFLLALAVLQRRDLEKILTWFAHQGPAWISAQVRARLAVSLRSGLSCLDVLQAGRRL